jgi:CBS domain-containing protein
MTDRNKQKLNLTYTMIEHIQRRQPKAEDIKREVITLEPDKTLYDARNALFIYNISRVVIAKDNKPLGIVTEKDIAWYLYTEIPNRRLDEVATEDVMSKDLITVGEYTNLQLCAKLMLENKISSVLVVDNNKDLRGIITKSDLVNTYATYYKEKNSVEEYMTEQVLTITPDEPIHTVILLMINNKVSRIVVVREERPIGIITGRDLLPVSALFMTAAYAVYWRTREDLIALRKEQKFLPSGIKNIFLAREIMKHNPITVTREADLTEAAQIMSRNRISGLPVVNSVNNLVGIVTSTDITRALVAG